MLLTWLSGYTQSGYTQPGMDKSILHSGLYAAVPALVMFISELTIGGWWVDQVIGRGANGNKVRKGVMVAGLLVALLTVAAAFSHNATELLSYLREVKADLTY